MSKFMTLLAVILFAANALYPFAARADKGDTTLVLNVMSWHDEDSYCYENECGQSYNENNFGLGAKYEFQTGFEVVGGFFDNSYNQTSVYAGMNFKHTFKLMDGILEIEPGLQAGFMSGYDDTPQRSQGLRPMLLPNITAKVNHAQITIGYLPAIGDDTVGITTLQLGWTL